MFLVFKSVYSNDGDCVSEWNVAMYCGTLESSNWEDSGGLTATNGIKFMPRPRECFHTDPGVDGNRRPWWSVYLGQVYKILYVKITSRTDCCGQWLKKPQQLCILLCLTSWYLCRLSNVVQRKISNQNMEEFFFLSYD